MNEDQESTENNMDKQDDSKKQKKRRQSLEYQGIESWKKLTTPENKERMRELELAAWQKRVK